MNGWLDYLMNKRKLAVNRLSELEMQKQDFLSKETSCNESKTDLHADMLKTMYEIAITLAEQQVLMVDEQSLKLNILMDKNFEDDEE